MFRSISILAAMLIVVPFVDSARAAQKPEQQYVGIMVSWEQVDKPNRLLGALRGAALGAALTPPPTSAPSGAGDGVSRTAQGTIAAQQAGERTHYPTRSFTIYSFHSGYYVVSASMRSSKRADVRTGDTLRFRIKNHTLFLTDDLGKTFNLRIVQVHQVPIPYFPAAGTGKAFSPDSP